MRVTLHKELPKTSTGHRNKICPQFCKCTASRENYRFWLQRKGKKKRKMYQQMRQNLEFGSVFDTVNMPGKKQSCLLTGFPREPGGPTRPRGPGSPLK